jgi:hypothetical protein
MHGYVDADVEANDSDAPDPNELRGRMTKCRSEPPTCLTSTTLTTCAHVDTCLLGAGHVFLLHTLPLPGLRIKTCLLHSFGIIINYYSQGLKPLSLSPLSNLSTPFPLPTLWKLSPPSLFLRGRSARNDVYIFINDLHIYIYKVRLIGLGI